MGQSEFRDNLASAVLIHAIDDYDLVFFRWLLINKILKRLTDERLFVVTGNDDRNSFASRPGKICRR